MTAPRSAAQSGDEIAVVLSVSPASGASPSLGLRLAARNVRQYLRNGYMAATAAVSSSGRAGEVAKADPKLLTGHAMTALLPQHGGAVVLGFLRHDRYQSRFRFALARELTMDIETLIDRCRTRRGAERDAGAVRRPRARAGAGRLGPAGRRRLAAAAARAGAATSGWCSWYNLYASLSEPVLLEHLEAARRFREEKQAPFDTFLVDDGFTPEMGDWLEFRPTFPNGIKPVLDAAREAGFRPGSRSRRSSSATARSSTATIPTGWCGAGRPASRWHR